MRKREVPRCWLIFVITQFPHHGVLIAQNPTMDLRQSNHPRSCSSFGGLNQVRHTEWTSCHRCLTQPLMLERLPTLPIRPRPRSATSTRVQVPNFSCCFTTKDAENNGCRPYPVKSSVNVLNIAWPFTCPSRNCLARSWGSAFCRRRLQLSHWLVEFRPVQLAQLHHPIAFSGAVISSTAPTA